MGAPKSLSSAKQLNHGNQSHRNSFKNQISIIIFYRLLEKNVEGKRTAGRGQIEGLTWQIRQLWWGTRVWRNFFTWLHHYHRAKPWTASTADTFGVCPTLRPVPVRKISINWVRRKDYKDYILGGREIIWAGGLNLCPVFSSKVKETRLREIQNAQCSGNLVIHPIRIYCKEIPVKTLLHCRPVACSH